MTELEIMTGQNPLRALTPRCGDQLTLAVRFNVREKDGAESLVPTLSISADEFPVLQERKRIEVVIDCDQGVQPENMTAKQSELVAKLKARLAVPVRYIASNALRESQQIEIEEKFADIWMEKGITGFGPIQLIPGLGSMIWRISEDDTNEPRICRIDGDEAENEIYQGGVLYLTSGDKTTQVNCSRPILRSEIRAHSIAGQIQQAHRN